MSAAAVQPAPQQSAGPTEPVAERVIAPSRQLDDRDIRTIDQYRLSLAFAARRLLRAGVPTPAVARGRADIGLAIDTAGQLQAVRTVRSSGDAGLDEEAMALVRRGAIDDACFER